MRPRLISSILCLLWLGVDVIRSKPARHKNSGKNIEDAKKAQVELIKENILSQLSLTSRPKKKLKTPVVPQPIMDAFEMDVRESQISKSEAMLRPISVQRGSRVTIFSFEYPLHLPSDYAVTKAELSFFKLKSTNEKTAIHDYKLEELCTGSKMNIVTKPNFYEGWIIYDVRNTLHAAHLNQSCKNSTHVNVMFSAECTNCQDGDNLSVMVDSGFAPYLLVRMRRRIESRRKRGSSNDDVCGPKETKCCKRPFALRFVEIGWDDWILAPTEITSNFCQGTCDHKKPANVHETFLKKIINKGGKHVTKESCCVAKKYRSVPMLYQEENGLLYKKVILDTAVTECGCV